MQLYIHTISSEENARSQEKHHYVYLSLQRNSHFQLLFLLTINAKCNLVLSKASWNRDAMANRSWCSSNGNNNICSILHTMIELVLTSLLTLCKSFSPNKLFQLNYLQHEIAIEITCKNAFVVYIVQPQTRV